MVSWKEGGARSGWIPVSFIGSIELFLEKPGRGTKASGKVLHAANIFTFLFPIVLALEDL